MARGGMGGGGSSRSEAIEPLGGVGKAGAPLADAEPGEGYGSEEQKKRELRTRVAHRVQAATARWLLLECQIGYVVLYRISDTQ